MYQELYDEEVVTIRARLEVEDTEDEAEGVAEDEAKGEAEKGKTSQVAQTLDVDPAKLAPSS